MSTPVQVLHERHWKHDDPQWKAMAREFPRTRQIIPGPWDDEPDKVQWIDGATDLDCLMVRNHWGVWCGYVAVTEGHPFYGVSYGECPFEDCKESEESGYCDHSPDCMLNVHGGLTFSSFCDEDAEEGHGICHIPVSGRPDKVWWLGFDTGHAFDFQPAMGFGGLLYDSVEAYRDLPYVQEQCSLLAAQLKAIVA